MRYGETIEQHDKWLIDQINSVVKKRDILYILGDLAFGNENLVNLKKILGQKHLVLGNHDKGDMSLYMPYFQCIYGMKKYKGFWLSHAPLHHQSRRGLFNIHGHVHQNSVPDPRYINVCVEVLNGVPLSFEQILEIREERLASMIIPENELIEDDSWEPESD
jgi:calcineurin-like phosphoesterase family protein